MTESHAFLDEKGRREFFFILTESLEELSATVLKEIFGYFCPVRIILHHEDGKREIYNQEAGPLSLEKVGEM